MVSTKAYRLQRALDGNPMVDNRKGDRHKEGYARPNPRPKSTYRKPSKWHLRHIRAWDGEGANLDSGEHVYNLLANSNGDYIIEHKGLSTEQTFDFFLENSNEDDINVIFGGSYDINMILRDVPREELQELWKSGKLYWKTYRILWATRKKFSVQKIKNGRVTKTFILWDVIGYYQSSFVVACERWLGDLDVLEDIQRMKLERSSFKTENINEIIEYNRKECVLLVMLVDRLFASLDEAAIELSRYDGAGSIAAAILRKYNIKKYKGIIPPEVNRWAQYAYSGGRIEAVKCGTTAKPTKVYRYDINSAYPSACIDLPSYVGATWKEEKEWDGSNNSLACVRYHFSKDAPFYPLWYRDNSGGISYPREGYGVYWGAEVANLYRYYQEGTDFEIEWALNATIRDKTSPFECIKLLYQIRKAFKAKGSMASESLKLGLNSIYGKLVQQAGYRSGRIPTYHQLLWGGQITAFTRAKLFDAAMQAPKDVISFATDAVFTTKPLELSCSGELGDWTYDEFQGITIVQAGVYFLDCSNHHKDEDCKHCKWKVGDEESKWQEKFRGFDKGSLQREAIIECWRNGTNYEATLTRFVGLGSALASTDFSIWRTWRTDSRKLDISPTGKRISGPKRDYHNGLRVTKPCPNITQDVLSEPYAIEWIDGIANKAKFELGGVTLEVLVDEQEDGGL